MLAYPCPAMSFALPISTLWTTPEMPSALTSTTELDAEGGSDSQHDKTPVQWQSAHMQVTSSNSVEDHNRICDEEQGNIIGQVTQLGLKIVQGVST